MLRDVQSSVSGTPQLILRLEGFCLLAGSLWAFQVQHAGWALFAVLFFAPDVSILGYLVNPRIGAVAYNAVHTTMVYGPLAAYGYLSGVLVRVAVGLIGLGHIGFDRLLGYGLKYPLGFGYTQLGRMGKEATNIRSAWRKKRAVATPAPRSPRWAACRLSIRAADGVSR